MEFKFNEEKISKEDFYKLNEDDVYFITNPGRMYDEDGSTFIIKKDGNYKVYRVDGWMYSPKDYVVPITHDDMFKVFPKWEECWKHSMEENENDKYKFIYMGFGNGLSVDKRIYKKYSKYLLDELNKKNNRNETSIDNYDYVSILTTWIKALENMINDEKKD